MTLSFDSDTDYSVSECPLSQTHFLRPSVTSHWSIGGHCQSSHHDAAGRSVCRGGVQLRPDAHAGERSWWGYNGTAGWRGCVERDRPESYTVDVRASDLKLSHSEKPMHPCLSYRTWLYSVLIGVRGQEVKGQGLKVKRCYSRELVNSSIPENTVLLVFCLYQE